MNLKPPTLLAAAAIIGLVVAACGGVQRDAQPQVRVTAGVVFTPTLVPTHTPTPAQLPAHTAAACHGHIHARLLFLRTPPCLTYRRILRSTGASYSHCRTPATVVDPRRLLIPTHTAVPTAVVPTPFPLPTLTPVATPTQLPIAPRAETFIDRVWQMAVMLAEDLSPRESATDQELEAAMFLAGQFKEWGYEVELQEFDAPDTSLFYVTGFSVLTPNIIYPYEEEYTFLDDRYNMAFFTLPLDPTSLTPGQVESAVTGPLIYAAQGTRDDIAGLDLDGKIVLIERGGLLLGEKVDLAAEAGAAAAVVFSNVPGDKYFWERIIRDVPIPAVGITRNQGLALIEALEAGKNMNVEVSRSYFDTNPSRNVIAELNNDIDDDQVLIIGAHFDTTPDSSGANDNGSGVAVVSILAQELADDEMPFDLRFILFGAEETGLNGSYHYVQELGTHEMSRIMAMINIDSVGAGDISVLGSERLRTISLRRPMQLKSSWRLRRTLTRTAQITCRSYTPVSMRCSCSPKITPTSIRPRTRSSEWVLNLWRRQSPSHWEWSTVSPSLHSDDRSGIREVSGVRDAAGAHEVVQK